MRNTSHSLLACAALLASCSAQHWSLQAENTGPALGWGWAQGADLAPPVALDERHQRIVAWGRGRWEWREPNWRIDVSAPPQPPGQVLAMTYDGHRGVQIAACQVQNAIVLAEWNGVIWHVPPVTAAPPMRLGFGFAFDIQRKRIVLFGGGVGTFVTYGTGGVWVTAPRDDIWEWNGTA